MTREEQETRCKGCAYYEVYYHGIPDSWMKEHGIKMFEHRCMWTLKDPAEMDLEQCNRKEK